MATTKPIRQVSKTITPAGSNLILLDDGISMGKATLSDSVSAVVGDLPYSFIKADNAGAGTANAIQATTSVPIPAGDGAALIILNVTANNTGAATVSFNGGAALTIKTASGADVQADYLAAGAVVSGFVVGSKFQLTSDVGTEAAAAAAQAAADAAVAAAINASGLPPVQNMDALKAQPSTTKPVNYLREEGRQGVWSIRSGDFSTLVSADTYNGVSFKPNDADATEKAGIRIFENTPLASWFGIIPGATNLAARLASSASALALIGKTTLDVGDEDITLDSIPDIHALANVRFIGKARFTGAYTPFYKPVIPRDAGPPVLSALEDIAPERQLKYINAAYARGETLVIELWGDSTLTEAPNTDIAHNNLIVGMIRRWARLTWPGSSITIRNFSIGGRLLTDWDAVNADGITPPRGDTATLTASYPWYNQGDTWDSHVGKQYPDETSPAHLVICNFGRNHNTGPEASDLTGVMDKLAALPLDQLWIIAGPPSLTTDPSGYQASWWDNQIGCGGLIRTACQKRDYGFFDFQRWLLAHVHGFDIRSGEVRRATETITPIGTPSSDTVATESTISGQTIITLDGTTWGASDVLQIGIGSGGVSGATYLQVSKTGGGNYGFNTAVLSGSSSITSGAVVDSGVAIPSGTGKLVVEWNDGYVSVWDTENGALTTSRAPLYAARYVGKTAPAKAYVLVRGTGATLTLSQVRFRGANPRKFMPTTTDRELFFTDEGLMAGNSTNHETSRIGIVLRSLFDSVRGYTATPKLLSKAVSGPVYAPASTTETDTASIVIPAKAFIYKNAAAEFEAVFSFMANSNTKEVRLRLGATEIAAYSGSQSGGSVTLRGCMVVDNAGPGTAWARFAGEVVTGSGVTPFLTALRIDDGAGNTRFLSDETFKATLKGSGTAAEISLTRFIFRQIG